MSTQRQFRRGTASETAVFTGAIGEITVDETNKRAVIHDGVTPGGKPAARLDEVMLKADFSSFEAAMNAWLDSLPTPDDGAPGSLGSGVWWNNGGIPTRTL